MDLFVKTVVELVELRERLKKSKGTIKTYLGDKRIKTLFRGLPLYKLLQRIQGGGLPEKWKRKKIFDESSHDEIIEYLTGKITVDPAPLSTSTNITVVKKFFNLDAVDKGSTGALLVIDASNYGKGQDMVPYSTEKYEKEVLLPMGVKLKIKSVTFKKEGSDGYFEANCVPV